MLEEFKKWFGLHAEELKASGLQVTVITPTMETSNPSICAEIESGRHLAGIYLWESGACDRFVLEVSSGEQIIAEHSALRSAEEVPATLAAFCDRLEALG